jgi:hypothetical protein
MDNLRARASKGPVLPIRIILVDPASRALSERRILDELKTIDPMTDGKLAQWAKGIEGLEDLANDHPGALSIRLTSLPVPSSMFILDDHLYLTPYVFGERGSTAICYHFAKRGLTSVYDLYDRNFERFWTYLTQEQQTARV